VQGKYGETGLGAYKPDLIDEFIRNNYKISESIGKYYILKQK